MTRNRQIVVGAHAARSSLSATVAALAVTAAQMPSNRVIENRGQALPKGAQRAIQKSRTDRRHLKREAVKELMDMTRRSVVVAHLHPRWLRREVEHLMDIGVNVTMEMVNGLRDMGPLADD